ncbi:hypothetical protein E2C01_025418 [Portunus trituberculatus]|uniref:Uncharacterized protein n=1 Tax=Portunus trituberculatus TaxID=210409 RepID=A0A5B7EHV8_PORTR|nr:hypothetical protein [Portunus trituberculatus]
MSASTWSLVSSSPGGGWKDTTTRATFSSLSRHADLKFSELKISLKQRWPDGATFTPGGRRLYSKVMTTSSDILRERD